MIFSILSIYSASRGRSQIHPALTRVVLHIGRKYSKKGACWFQTAREMALIVYDPFRFNNLQKYLKHITMTNDEQATKRSITGALVKDPTSQFDCQRLWYCLNASNRLRSRIFDKAGISRKKCSKTERLGPSTVSRSPRINALLTQHRCSF